MSLASLKRLLRPTPLIHEVEIRELIDRALQLQARLTAAKASIAPKEFGWYPWDSFGTLFLLERMLSGANRFLLPLAGSDPILDLGCGDGDLSFLFESLGCRVCAVDHPESNYNRMQGVAALKTELQSSVRIEAIDLDRELRLPIRRSGLALFLGILYHLKNPYGVLEVLSGVARYCLLSTAVTRFAPDRATPVEAMPAAFLADRDGLRGDDTNYWIFSEAGLRTLLDRTGWEVCEWSRVRDDDSVLWHAQTDERVLCLLRSRAFPRVRPTQLGGGWHSLEAGAWRWTERRFSILVAPDVSSLKFDVTVPPLLALPLTIRCGQQVFTVERAGDSSFTVAVPHGSERLEFEVDTALPPDASDARERGLIVRNLNVL